MKTLDTSPLRKIGLATAVKEDVTRKSWTVRIIFYGGLVAVGAIMTLDIPREAIAGLAAVLMVLLLFMKVPIAVAMALPGAYALWLMRGFAVVEGSFRTIPYGTVAVWSYTVLPMFIFMGLLLWRAGITERLYSASKLWLSWLPGGLAVGTNFAGAGLASVSGSTVATVSAIGRIGVPEMIREKYDPRMATGAVLIAGTGGQLIPPSIYMVIYAGLVSVPVGPQLMAGLVPGIVLHIFYAVMIVAIALAFPHLVGRVRGQKDAARLHNDGDPSLWTQRWRSLAGVWPVPALILVMFGGMYAGFFTATEGGAIGAFGAVVLAIVYLRGKTLSKALTNSLTDTVSSTAGIFFLFIGAMIFNRALTVSGAAESVSLWIDSFGLDPVQFLLALIVMYLLLGMVLDPLTMMLLTVPVLLPTLMEMHISLVFFGVFVVMLGELAVVTPPVGMISFILYKISQDKDVNRGTEITLRHVFEGALWFIPISIVLLIVLIFYPDMALWLPELMNANR